MNVSAGISRTKVTCPRLFRCHARDFHRSASVSAISPRLPCPLMLPYLRASPKLLLLSRIVNCDSQIVKSYSCTNSLRQLSTTLPKTKKEKVTVTFIKKDGTRIIAEGKEGDSLYDIVINNHLDIDGYGACEGTASCSTCHLILHKKDYDRLEDKPSDEEQDLLDLAFDLTDTSRLGCMVHMTKELDGIEVSVPEGINDARVI